MLSYISVTLWPSIHSLRMRKVKYQSRIHDESSKLHLTSLKFMSPCQLPSLQLINLSTTSTSRRQVCTSLNDKSNVCEQCECYKNNGHLADSGVITLINGSHCYTNKIQIIPHKNSEPKPTEAKFL
jgi:hypothetical protein